MGTTYDTITKTIELCLTMGKIYGTISKATDLWFNIGKTYDTITKTIELWVIMGKTYGTISKTIELWFMIPCQINGTTIGFFYLLISLFHFFIFFYLTEYPHCRSGCQLS